MAARKRGAPVNKSPRHLVWLRADLRTADNTALAAACADAAAEVACVYAITPAQWQAHDVAGVRIDFELRTLAALQRTLEGLNIPLLVVEAADFASLPAAFATLVQAHDIDAVFANRQYEVNEITRDEAVAAVLAPLQVPLQLFHDQCVLPPGRVLTGEGRFYAVFTPFKRNWLAQIDTAGLALCPAPSPRRGRFAKSSALPRQVTGFASHVDAGIAADWCGRRSPTAHREAETAKAHRG